MSTPAGLPDKVAEAFRALHERTRRILAVSTEGASETTDSNRKLMVIRPSVQQLARTVEATDEFPKLAKALFKYALPVEDMTDKERRQALAKGVRAVRELMRRSGYYHAVLAGEPPEPYWNRIVERLQLTWGETAHVLVLGRIRFPRSRFEIGGCTVLQPQELVVDLGASRQVCEDFYPTEGLDEALGDHWVLVEPMTRRLTAVGGEADAGLDTAEVDATLESSESEPQPLKAAEDADDKSK
jgi:hypothetical protein